MAVATIEGTLELWASSLRDVKARIGRLFTQDRVADSAGLFIDGLLSSEQRKTGWLRAEVAGDPGHGDNKRSSGAADGMPRISATSSVTTPLRRSPTIKPFL